ncbi:MAG: diguanylate cyclase [Alkalinema sp. RL_2_19]|nr:diguanylate cyclase [Alkalinema sp. RL_2_19]
MLTLLLLVGGVSRNLEAIASGVLRNGGGTSTWDERLVLVKIDQHTLDALGWFPLRRDYYAGILARLTQSGQNTVVFDLIFSETAAEDPDLHKAMLDHGHVVLGAAWMPNGKAWKPTPQLESAAIAVGHIAKDENPLDASLLAIAPVQQNIPALSIATLQAYALGGGDISIPGQNLGPNQILSLAQPFTLNWPDSFRTLPQYSLVDVLQGKIPPQQFDDKIVLVGVTAPGIDDHHIAFSQASNISGVELQATAINNLLRQNGLKVFPAHWLPVVIVGLGMAWGWLLRRLPTRRQLLVMCLAPVLWIGAGWIADLCHYRLPIALPVILLGLVSVLALSRDRLQLDQVNQRLQQQVTIDALTKVHNRYFLEQAFDVLWQRLMRERGEIALILCDIDYFKLYNDSQGHPAGDRCLHQVAQTIQQCLKRPEDFVARYGGEEFAVVLPHTSRNGAIRIAEQIQRELAQLALSHPGSPQSGNITMSLGIAACLVSDQTSNMLLKQADQALYQAKRLGRDRYVIAD